jgi:hypothetical protein
MTPEHQERMRLWSATYLARFQHDKYMDYMAHSASVDRADEALKAFDKRFNLRMTAATQSKQEGGTQ